MKSVPKKVTISVDCQTPLSWIGPQPSLRDASRLPSVITKTTGTGTSETNASSSRKNSPAKSDNRTTSSNNKTQTRKPDGKAKVNSKDIETSNKFDSLSDVDEDMDTTQHHHRPSRSQSRSRSRSKNISPIKHR